jgi:Flp pilus assembly protein TadB
VNRAALAVILSMSGAALCAAAYFATDGRIRARAIRLAALQRTQDQLIRAELPWLPPAVWLGGRFLVGLAAGAAVFVLFRIHILGIAALLVTQYLSRLWLVNRQRSTRLSLRSGLVETGRYAVALLDTGASLTQMLTAIARTGPQVVRPVFRGLIEETESAATSLTDQVEKMRISLAEPVFDDFARAILLHRNRGARLAPALRAITDEWHQEMQLEREAKAHRAQVETSVLLLAVLPWVWLSLLQLLNPSLLQPFRSLVGQSLIAAALLWMLLGHKVLTGLADPGRVSIQLPGVKS